MILKVSPDRFREKALTFRSYLGADHVAEVDGLRAGWVLQGDRQGVTVWWWTMTGPCCGHGRIASHGESRSLEIAKDEFRQAFEYWKKWALSEAEQVTWFGSAFAMPQSSFLPEHP